MIYFHILKGIILFLPVGSQISVKEEFAFFNGFL